MATLLSAIQVRLVVASYLTTACLLTRLLFSCLSEAFAGCLQYMLLVRQHDLFDASSGLLLLDTC